jgi:hypothetical protein
MTGRPPLRECARIAVRGPVGDPVAREESPAGSQVGVLGRIGETKYGCHARVADVGLELWSCGGVRLRGRIER